MNTKNTKITSADTSPLAHQQPDPSDRWVTKPEVAAHLRISIRSVEKRMSEGLPYHPFGRSIRFLLSEVDAYARTVTLKIDTSGKKIDPVDTTQQDIGLSDPP